MKRAKITAALVAAALTAFWAPDRAEACEYREAGGEAQQLGSLGEGTSRGQLVCGGEVTPMAVWTLGVDGSDPTLGLRVRPLFRMGDANPLVEVARLGVGDAQRLTVFRRRADVGRRASSGTVPDAGPPFRLFGTICDRDERPALDCAFGASRIKARADVFDGDGDGKLDRLRHQISIWDGADRLQVVMFMTPYRAGDVGAAADWIDMLDALDSL